MYIGASPKTLCATGRTDDLQAIVHIINSAKKYIYIAINEYIPMDLWKKRQPWTVIDDQIREGDNKLRTCKYFHFSKLIPLFSSCNKKEGKCQISSKLKSIPYGSNAKTHGGSSEC